MDVSDGRGRYHSFSGIDTDKTVMDNFEAPLENKAKALPEEWAWAVKEVQEKGFVILKNLLTREETNEIRQQIQPLLNEQTGRNNFEGFNTKRVYSVVGKTRALDKMIAHPVVMGLLHQWLLPNYLLTAAQVIDIQPGETPQPFHYDDQFCRVPRPRQPFSMATVWALDDNFKAENGATVVVPKSHLWDDRRPEKMEEMAIPAELPIGSCVFFTGTLWHGGGANVSVDTNRCAFTAQYCQPWVRQQENMMMSVPFQEVQELPEAIQSMIGYSIHPPFIGHVDGRHPLKAAERLAKL